MNAIRSNNVSLKYQWFTSSACKDIGFTKTEFVAKTQFLYIKIICRVFSSVYLVMYINNQKYFLKRMGGPFQHLHYCTKSNKNYTASDRK